MTWTMRSHSSTGASITGPSNITPALLMTMSSRPNSSTTRWTAASASDRWVTSDSTGNAAPPASRTWAARVSSRSPRRATSPTEAPSDARRWAVAEPMPLDAPVTSATVDASGAALVVTSRV